MLKTRYKDDDVMEAGIDEAGRGCFWGPLMAAAVVLQPEAEWDDEMRALAPKLRDSKKVSPKRRVELAAAIKRCALAHGVGAVSATDLDAYGVTWANKTAFQRAVGELAVRPGRLVIDGILPCEYNAGEVVTVINGDATLMSIAAASILAKEAHDDWVRAYCAAHPDVDERYNLLSCKGYGTAKHRAALAEHGEHEEHRQRFIHGGGKTAGGYSKSGGSASKCLIAIEDADAGLE
jgi:ribonuclease HII